MLATTFVLSLLGIAAASPLVSRQVKPNYPPKSSSKGFTLVVNVTDPSAQLAHAVQNTFVSSIHTGAGLALVGVNSDSGRIFYQNGTVGERKEGKATIITDGGTPLTPSGFQLAKVTGAAPSSTSLNFGPGTPGVQLSSFPEGYAFLLPQTYLACNESIAYYAGKHFIVIKQVEATVCKETGKVEKSIPANCAPVRLIPQCDKLEDLPEGSYASHEFALDSECYPKVSELKWSEYGP
ncbi:Fc.00g050090.m01.CDS01 [Cosmosporella sp. VM-42]